MTGGPFGLLGALTFFAGLAWAAVGIIADASLGAQILLVVIALLIAAAKRQERRSRQ